MSETNFTIAILTYNRPDYLRVALESACVQTIQAAEILIVDDGSKCDNSSIVDQLSTKYGIPMRYVLRENGGHSPARNTAFDECHTEYLMWLDDDDALLPNAVESKLLLIEKEQDADIIYGSLILCDEQLSSIEPMAQHRLDGANKLHLFFKHSPAPNPACVIRKSCYQKVGPYNEVYKHAEDYDFFTRAASLGCKFVLDVNHVVLYRAHADNLATSKALKKAAHERVSVVENFIARHNIEEIFSHLDWQNDPNMALFEASLEMTHLFCRLGAYQHAKESLELGTFDQVKSISDFLSDVVWAAETNGISGLESKKAHPLFYSPITQHPIDCLLEWLCESEAEKLGYMRSYNQIRHERSARV